MYRKIDMSFVTKNHYHLVTSTLVAVRVSDAIAGFLAPSCYDSIIMIKRLPYLPGILPSSSSAYNIPKTMTATRTAGKVIPADQSVYAYIIQTML